MRKRDSLLNHEKTQDVEFFWTQVNSLAAHLDSSFLEVDTEVRCFYFRKNFVGAESSEDRTNASQQLSHRERLDDVVIRPGVESKDLIPLRVADRQHDDGPFKEQTNLAAGFQTAHIWHVDVQKN